MRALLEAVRAGRASRKRRGLAVAGVGIAAVAVWGLTRPEPPAAQCSTESLESTWTDEVSAEVRRQFTQTGVSQAEATWERVDVRLRQWLERWHEVAEETCEAEVNGPSPEQICLRWQAHEVEAFVALLSSADAGVVDHAATAAAQLPTPLSCVNASLQLDPAQANAQEVERLHRELARAASMLDAGRPELSLQKSEALVERAQSLSVRPLEAEALLLRGRAASQLRGQEHADATDPRTSLYAAWLAADASEHRVAAAEALVELTMWIVYARDHQDTVAWSERARVRLDALQGMDRQRAQLHWALGVSESWEGDFDASDQHLETALGLLADPLDPWRGRVLNTRGEISFVQADYASAEQDYRELLALVTDQYGSEHLWVSNALGNLAEVALARHQLETAESLFDRSKAIRTEVLGEDSYWVLHTQAHLADVYRRRGDLERARQGYELVRTAKPDSEDPSTCSRRIWATHGLALLALEQDQLAEAQELIDSVRDLPPTPDRIHLDLCSRLDIPGRIALARGDYDTAQKSLSDALRVLRQLSGDSHHSLVPVLAALSEVATATGRLDDARDLKRQATDVHEKDAATDPKILQALATDPRNGDLTGPTG